MGVGVDHDLECQPGKAVWLFSKVWGSSWLSLHGEAVRSRRYCGLEGHGRVLACQKRWSWSMGIPNKSHEVTEQGRQGAENKSLASG